MTLRLLLSLLMAATLATGAAQAEPVANATQAMNDFRARQGLPTLTQSDTLQQVAERHARDMAANGFFSHTGSDGSSVGQRATEMGYPYCTIAENIAKGQRSLGEVMAGWAGSPPHRRNMLLDRVTEFALARQTDNIWVMVLGRPGC